jgi:GNAT superfamily N-acetyltransferase
MSASVARLRSRCHHRDVSGALHALAADLPTLAETLASAFFDDPVSAWMYADPAARPEQLRRWMRLVVEMGITRGHVYTAGENRAAAVWSPPDVTLFDEVWAPRLAELMSEQLGERAGAVLRALGRGLAEHPAQEPHFYLFTLGTHAESQGSGLGARVIEPVLALCDAQGLPARLESSNPRNLPFYRRHGFEVLAEVVIADGGPVIRPMRRAPRSA